MCTPGIAKPSDVQLAGFGGGGTGVTITGYQPDFGSTYAPAAKYFSQNAALNLFPDKGGTYTLSDGSKVKSGELIANNQTNAYGQAIPAAGLDRGASANSFVGQELTAPPSPAPSPAPAAQQDSFGTSGGGQSGAQAPAEKASTVVQEASALDRRRKRMRTATGGNNTLVTGGQGVAFGSSSGGKQLYGQ